ncbi:MAG: NAD(P)-dependent alcohol dehydrogenase [Bacteroidota bacterium]
MKAVFRSQYGSHDVIQIGEMPVPTIKPDEALVKVSVTTVNRTDQGVITGLPYIFRFFTGLGKPKHSILGTDFAGEIVEVGANYSAYKVGDKVWGFNDHSWPTQAELTIINKNISTALIPSYITDKQVVASAEAFHYAINFINKVNLKPGKKAFVFGATGAIGSAMIQILKYNGLYVVASCKAAYFDKIKPLGADKLFDYETEKISEITEKFDYFFDAVGKSDFKTSKLILNPVGIYISTELGPGNENLYLPILTMWSKQKVIFPFPSNIPESMLLALKMISENAFSPLIDREYRIDEAQNAYRYMMSGQKIGNVILKIG